MLLMFDVLQQYFDMGGKVFMTFYSPKLCHVTGYCVKYILLRNATKNQ